MIDFKVTHIAGDVTYETVKTESQIKDLCKKIIENNYLDGIDELKIKKVYSAVGQTK